MTIRVVSFLFLRPSSPLSLLANIMKVESEKNTTVWHVLPRYILMHLCYRPIKCVHDSGLICRRLYPTRKPTLQKNIWDYALFCQLDAVLDWFRVTGRNAMTSKTHRDDTISLHTYWSSHVLMMRAMRITVHAHVWKKKNKKTRQEQSHEIKAYRRDMNSLICLLKCLAIKQCQSRTQLVQLRWCTMTMIAN